MKLVNDRYRDPDWASKQLGVSRQAIYRLIRLRQLGGVLKLGRRILIDVEKFEAWAASQTT